MADLLEVRNLRVKADQSVILDIPNLVIHEGEVLVILGPNGAGKSTLLQVLAGLRKEYLASVRFLNLIFHNPLEYRRQVSTVFQSPLLLRDTVENNIASGLQFRGVSSQETKRRVNFWMERLKIAHLAKRQADKLSGGEAQRVSLARAFCLETPLICMDEPFSALDTPTRLDLLEDLHSIFSEFKQTCCFVTHDLEEALAIGDRVAVFFSGKMHQLDSCQQVFLHPSTPETATFVGVETIIPGKVTANDNGLCQIKIDGAILESVGYYPVGMDVFLCLRPEDITLLPADQQRGPSSARNQLRGKVCRLTHQGPLIRVQLDAGIPVTALITRPSAQEMNIQPGDQLLAVFKASAAHLIPRINRSTIK